MRKTLVRGAAVALTAGALVAGETSAAFASDRGERHQVVDVRGDGSTVHLDHARVDTGSITFRVHTTNASSQEGGGSSITMFKPRGGKTVADVLKDAAEEFDPATAAQGTKDLQRDATFYGLADVVAGSPVVVTETLSPGTYYLVETGAPPTSGAPAYVTLTVGSHREGAGEDSDLRSQVRVRTVEPDRFVAPRQWPHSGTFTFTNSSGTLHFVELARVVEGTTDKQVQDYFDSQAKLPPDQQTPPTFAVMGQPSTGAQILSPGRSLQLSYDLPRGTYVLLCFVADDATGMPHALMGMHEVVVLK